MTHLIHKTGNNLRNKGFIALMAVIIASFILLGLTFTVSQNSFNTRFSVLDREYKRTSLSLSESCVNQALLEIARDPNYGGGVPVSLNATQKCTIEPVTYYNPATSSSCSNPTSGYDSNHKKIACINTQANYNGAFSNMQIKSTVHDPNFMQIAPTTLTVTAVVPQLKAGDSLTDFVLKLDTNPVISGQTYQVTSANPHTVSVTPPAGYTTTGWAGNCDSSGKITPAAGTTNSCYIYYSILSTKATLTLVANIPTGTSLSNFPLQIDGQPTIDGQAVISGQALSVSTSSHTVSYSIVSGTYNASPWNGVCNPTTGVTGSLTAGQNYTCVINFTAPTLACADTVLMLDRTKTMSDDAVAFAGERDAAKALLDLYKPLNPLPYVGVGSFRGISGGTSSPAAEIINPGGHLMNTSLYNTLYTAINSIYSSTAKNTGTDLSQAITVAYNELKTYGVPTHKKVLIFMSDGDMTVGAEPLPDPTGAALNAADTLKKHLGADGQPDMKIYTVHYGNSVGQNLMAQLSNGTTPVTGHQPGSANDHIGTVTTNTGFLSPTNNAVDSGTGWSNPTSAYTSGGTPTPFATDSSNRKQRYYNFSDGVNALSTKIPATATIKGIEIKADASVTDVATPGSASIFPSANGNFNSWATITPSGSQKYTVTADAINTTYVSQGIDAQTFVVANPSPVVPAGATGITVTLNVIAQETNGNASIQLMAEDGSGATAHQILDNVKPLTATWATYSWPVPTKPDGTAWTVAEVNAWTTRFGVFKSSPGGTVQVSQVNVVVGYTNTTPVTPATSAIGNYDQFIVNSGSNTTVNRLTAIATSGGTYLSANTNGNAETILMSGAGVPVGATINSVTLNALVQEAGGSANFALRVEKGTGATNKNDDTGHNITNTTGFVNINRVMTTNPFTSTAWTVAEVNSWTTRFGVVRTNSTGGTPRVDQLYVTVSYTITATTPSLLPTAVGNFNSFTQNGGTSKQSAVADAINTTYVSQGIDAQTFVVANPSPVVPAGATGITVTLNVIAQETNGNASIQLMAEDGSGATAHQILDNVKPLTATWATYSWPVPTKPDGTAWTPAEVNAWTTRFGVFKSSPGGTVQVSQVNVVVGYTSSVVNTTCKLGVDLSWNGNSANPGWTTTQKTQTLTNTMSTLPSFGGATDLWTGHTWVPGDFSNTNFRVRVQDVNGGAGCAVNTNTNLDWLQAKVYYSTSGVDITAENSDGDNFYIAPTPADPLLMSTIFTDIGKAVCPAAAGASVATLKVSTQVINGNGRPYKDSDFKVTITGGGASPSSFDGSKDGVSVDVTPGASFTISQASPAPVYYAPQYIGCPTSVPAGTTAYCTIVVYDTPQDPVVIPSQPPADNIDINSWQETPN